MQVTVSDVQPFWRQARVPQTMPPEQALQRADKADDEVVLALLVEVFLPVEHAAFNTHKNHAEIQRLALAGAQALQGENARRLLRDIALQAAHPSAHRLLGPVIVHAAPPQLVEVVVLQALRSGTHLEKLNALSLLPYVLGVREGYVFRFEAREEIRSLARELAFDDALPLLLRRVAAALVLPPDRYDLPVVTPQAQAPVSASEKAALAAAYTAVGGGARDRSNTAAPKPNGKTTTRSVAPLLTAEQFAERLDQFPQRKDVVTLLGTIGALPEPMRILMLEALYRAVDENELRDVLAGAQGLG